jgi:hypothetical protein
MRTSDATGTSMIVGIAIAALIVIGLMMLWSSSDTPMTTTTDSTRIERPATPAPNTPPANKPVTDTKPAPTPPAKAPAQ